MREDFKNWLLTETKKKSQPKKALPPMLGDTGTIPSGIAPTDDELDQLIQQPLEVLPDDDDDGEDITSFDDLLAKLPKIGEPKPEPSVTSIEINWKPLSTGKKPKAASKPNRRKK